jgi:hypothetical protein
MAEANELVPDYEPLFRYRSTDSSLAVGIPTNKQRPDLDQILIEIDLVFRSREDNLWRYVGQQVWIGIAQLIRIEEVAHADQS